MICVESCVPDDCDQIKGQINCKHVFCCCFFVVVASINDFRHEYIYVHVYDVFVKV